MKSENRGGENKCKRREDAKRKGQKQKVGRSGKKEEDKCVLEGSVEGRKGTARRRRNATHSLARSLSLLLAHRWRAPSSDPISEPMDPMWNAFERRAICSLLLFSNFHPCFFFGIFLLDLGSNVHLIGLQWLLERSYSCNCSPPPPHQLIFPPNTATFFSHFFRMVGNC